jgi:hypothetical protein
VRALRWSTALVLDSDSPGSPGARQPRTDPRDQKGSNHLAIVPEHLDVTGAPGRPSSHQFLDASRRGTSGPDVRETADSATPRGVSSAVAEGKRPCPAPGVG